MQISSLDDFCRKNAIDPVRMFHEQTLRDRISVSPYIFGWDTVSDRLLLFYGRQRLEDISRGRESEFLAADFLCFKLTAPIEEQIDLLYAAVKTLKGSCC